MYIFYKTASNFHNPPGAFYADSRALISWNPFQKFLRICLRYNTSFDVHKNFLFSRNRELKLLYFIVFRSCQESPLSFRLNPGIRPKLYTVFYRIISGSPVLHFFYHLFYNLINLYIHCPISFAMGFFGQSPRVTACRS